MSTYSACRDATCYRVGCGTCNDRRRIEARNKSISLSARIVELIIQHGSLRAAGRVLKIDHAYLSRLSNGSKREPSPAVLKKLGLSRVITYVPLVKNDPAEYLTRSKLVQSKFGRVDRTGQR